MRSDESRTILVVDDDDTFRNRLIRAFRERGLEPSGAKNTEAAVAAATADSPELAVVDLRMPGRSGLDVVRELKAIDPSTNIVVLTGYGSIATALESVRLGATHYLTKPADADEILAAFDRDKATANAAVHLEHETPSLARTEWEHIQRVLTDYSGNISHAARVLGVHRRSLQRKLSRRPAAR